MISAEFRHTNLIRTYTFWTANEPLSPLTHFRLSEPLTPLRGTHFEKHWSELYIRLYFYLTEDSVHLYYEGKSDNAVREMMVHVLRTKEINCVSVAKHNMRDFRLSLRRS